MEFFDYENNDNILKTTRNIYRNQLNKEVAAIEDAYYKSNGIDNETYGKQIRNAYTKYLKRTMPTIRNSNLGSLKQLSYLKNNSPKAYDLINIMARGLGTTPDIIMSYYNNEEFMKALGPNKVRFIREELKGLNNKSIKNIAKNINGGPLLEAAIATPFIANALFNPAYANNRGEEIYKQATDFIAPVGAYEGFQGQGGGIIPALGGFLFGPDVSTPLKQDALTGAYADRYTRFNLNTPDAAEVYRQTRPRGEW